MKQRTESAIWKTRWKKHCQRNKTKKDLNRMRIVYASYRLSDNMKQQYLHHKDSEEEEME